jgi:hypothetical protein
MQVWYHFESSLLYHLDTESNSIDITTTDKPLLEIIVAASESVNKNNIIFTQNRLHK